MQYRILDQNCCYRGYFRMDVYTVTHERFDGGSITVKRENMERGDAAALLLYDPACDEVLLLEQFRIGPAVRHENPWLTEIIAGIVDDGETPEQAARREAVEEAGYMPKELRHLGRYYTTPGACSERIDLFLACVDKTQRIASGGGCDEEHEDIRSTWVKRTTAMEMLAQGRINSGAPMLALLLAFGAPGRVPAS